MPPAPRHKHGLSWSLNALNNFGQLSRSCQPLFGFKSRKQDVEVLNSFVVLSLVPKVFAPYEGLVYSLSWLEEHPSFASLNGGVPGTCHERVDVNFAA